MAQESISNDDQQVERRSTERQISVLINAGITHEGDDALCRIRNLSSGGVMIECALALKMDDLITLQLRTGRKVTGQVRWISENRAGVAFANADAAQMVTQRLAAQDLHTSPIGFPLFRREAWAKLTMGHKSARSRIAALSPTGISLENAPEWEDERILGISIEGLGDHLVRVSDIMPRSSDDELNLHFMQPLNYRILSDWLAQQPRKAVMAGDMQPMSDQRSWTSKQ